jgi:hypothetical protein
MRKGGDGERKKGVVCGMEKKVGGVCGGLGEIVFGERDDGTIGRSNVQCDDTEHTFVVSMQHTPIEVLFCLQNVWITIVSRQVEYRSDLFGHFAKDPLTLSCDLRRIFNSNTHPERYIISMIVQFECVRDFGSGV